MLAAAEILRTDCNIDPNIWSIPGINQLHRNGIETERWNITHPSDKPRLSYLSRIMEKYRGPAVISTDYVRAYPEQIRRLIPGKTTILGTDGFGRSDTRENLRRFFEVDRYYIVLSVLSALRENGKVSGDTVKQAMKKYGLDPEKLNPAAL